MENIKLKETIKDESNEDIGENEDNQDQNMVVVKENKVLEDIKLKSEDVNNSSFSCEICSKLFSTKRSLTFHRYTHTKKRVICSVCGKEFSKLSVLTTHMKCVHVKELDFACVECDYKTFCKRKLQVHIRTHTGEKPFACEKCAKCFTDPSSLKSHKEYIHDGNQFPCETCGKSYNTTTLLNQHWSYVHKVQENLNCNLCSKPCQNMNKLKRHTLKCLTRTPQFLAIQRTHYEQFTQQILLAQTIQFNINNKEDRRAETAKILGLSSPNHTKDEPCLKEDDMRIKKENKTGDIFAFGVAHLVEPQLNLVEKNDMDELNGSKQSGDELDQSIDDDWIKEESDSNQEDDPDLKDRDDESGPHNKKEAIKKTSRPTKVCPICAADVKYLQIHIKTQHPEAPPENHSCKECSKVFSNHKKLYLHCYSVHRDLPSMCDICSQVFKNPSILRSHKRQVHDKVQKLDRKFMPPSEPKLCPICAKEVRDLRGHIRNQHTEIPRGNFECNECGKVFDMSKKLSYHKSAIHRKIPSMCTVCSQVMKNPHALRSHMRIVHEEISEQTCGVCYKTFETKMKLYFHNRAVHKSNRCEICGKAFRSKNLLQKHQSEYHQPHIPSSMQTTAKIDQHSSDPMLNFSNIPQNLAMHFPSRLNIYPNKTWNNYDEQNKL
eukprot:GFUD01018133.1.p1 GENE.GFUD01018133.1~~GFUD01018133.1.p1  ORF type:complete len:661 (-),score=121.67 GFUD01018133.1:43-2025(-)